MKMMMVINTLRNGGAERVMSVLCNELSARHQVRLLLLQDDKTDYPLSPRVEVRSSRIKHHDIVHFVRFIRGQMTEWQPDIVLSFMTPYNNYTLIANILNHHTAPVVIAERGDPYYGKAFYYKAIRRVVTPSADGAVFQTKQAQAYYQKMLRCPSAILPNPLNPIFLQARYEGERTKRIVTTGRLHVKKNFPMLIRAFAKIAPQIPEYTLQIYGNGPMQEALEQQIRESGLEERVLLMGRSDHLEQEIRDAALFAFPSDSEGMPNSLLEAMALGLPCISTDCPIGGPATVIKEKENGMLVPVGDADAMADAMLYMLTHPREAEAMGCNAAETVKVNDPYEVGLRWEKFLMQVAGQTE